MILKVQVSGRQIAASWQHGLITEDLVQIWCLEALRGVVTGGTLHVGTVGVLSCLPFPNPNPPRLVLFTKDPLLPLRSCQQSQHQQSACISIVNALRCRGHT